MKNLCPRHIDTANDQDRWAVVAEEDSYISNDVKWNACIDSMRCRWVQSPFELSRFLLFIHYDTASLALQNHAFWQVWSISYITKC